MTNALEKQMCSMCVPKERFAVASCKGCSKDFCRKHFNEHRDQLSKSLDPVFHLHDSLLQELQLKLDGKTIQPVDDNASIISKQIDDWEKETLCCVSQAANDARREVVFDELNNKMKKLTQDLREQQDSESFVETDINQWIKQLEKMKNDLYRSLYVHGNAPTLQIKDVDWKNIIKVSLHMETSDVDSIPLWMEKWMGTAEILLKIEKEEKKEMKEKGYINELEQKELELKEMEKKLPWWEKK